MTNERLIGDAAINQEDPNAGQGRQLGWRWKTNAAGKVAKNIYVKIPSSGVFDDGCRAQFWKVDPSPDRKQNIDIGGLGGTPGVWIRVPGFAVTSLVQDDFYYVTVFHPASDPGNHYFQNDFGNPISGSLSGQNIFKTGGTEDQPPDDLTFIDGGFAVDIEIGDASAPASSVLSPLQKAVYTRLTGDATLTGLATGGGHDQVPEDKTRPFWQIGDAIETPHNSHDRFGRNTLITLVVWSEFAGFSQAAAIVDRIVGLLDHQRRSLSVDGHRVCSIRHVQAQPLRDPDPRYRQIPVAFRVITEQE